jgi:uncharacterized protein (DUF2126 family)
MGFRLPVDSLPWVSATDYPYATEADPMSPRPPLPPYGALRARPEPRLRLPGQPATPGRLESGGGTVRTALCVEPRRGVLSVFMPPVAALEEYLDLVAGVEATAAQLGTPILLEGYPPPADPRLAHFLITPDPGVIEVNVHPAASWDELVERTTALYEEARQVDRPTARSSAARTS